MRLRQSSSVAEYTSQFEALSNRLGGNSEKNRLSCFLRGLKDDIRLSVRMLNPGNLVAAFDLAKLQEEYIQSLRRPIRSSSSSFSFGRQQSWSHTAASPNQSLLPSSSTTVPPPKPSSGFSVQRISAGQMKKRRDKGLCYYCDDKWQPSHKCKAPKLYLLSRLELPPEEPADEVLYDSTDLVDFVPEFVVVECKEPEISLNAISGSPGSKSMRLVGFLHS
jgi:hypothetical protein